MFSLRPKHKINILILHHARHTRKWYSSYSLPKSLCMTHKSDTHMMKRTTQILSYYARHVMRHKLLTSMQTQQNNRIHNKFNRIAHYAIADTAPCGANTKATQYTVQRRVLHYLTLICLPIIFCRNSKSSSKSAPKSWHDNQSQS